MPKLRAIPSPIPIRRHDIYGVYFLFRGTTIVYVGSGRVQDRILWHLNKKQKRFDSVSYFKTPRYLMRELERQYIERLQPEYNIRGVAERDRASREMAAAKTRKPRDQHRMRPRRYSADGLTGEALRFLSN